MKRTVESAFWIGDIVYRKMDTEGEEIMITEVHFTPGGVTYSCSVGGGYDSTFYEMELSKERAWPRSERDDEGTERASLD